MKVYLDYCIIEEWLKFKSSGVSFTDYAEIPKKNHNIIKGLEAFKKILNIHSVTFLYSSIHELESFKGEKSLFENLVSRNNFVQVPAIGLRGCMVDPKFPKDTILEIGECQSYFASHIRKFGPKDIKDRINLMKYMREKFFDPMHIDSALKAGADIFLTIDNKLLNSINNYPKFRKWLSNKIRLFRPSEFMKEVATTHNIG